MPFLNIGSIENSYQLLIDLNWLKRMLAQPLPALPTSLIETEAQIKTHVVSSQINVNQIGRLKLTVTLYTSE